MTNKYDSPVALGHPMPNGWNSEENKQRQFRKLCVAMCWLDYDSERLLDLYLAFKKGWEDA